MRGLGRYGRAEEKKPSRSFFPRGLITTRKSQPPWLTTHKQSLAAGDPHRPTRLPAGPPSQGSWPRPARVTASVHCRLLLWLQNGSQEQLGKGEARSPASSASRRPFDSRCSTRMAAMPQHMLRRARPRRSPEAVAWKNCQDSEIRSCSEIQAPVRARIVSPLLFVLTR